MKKIIARLVLGILILLSIFGCFIVRAEAKSKLEKKVETSAAKYMKKLSKKKYGMPAKIFEEGKVTKKTIKKYKKKKIACCEKIWMKVKNSKTGKCKSKKGDYYEVVDLIGLPAGTKAIVMLLYGPKSKEVEWAYCLYY